MINADEARLSSYEGVDKSMAIIIIEEMVKRACQEHKFSVRYNGELGMLEQSYLLFIGFKVSRSAGMQGVSFEIAW